MQKHTNFLTSEGGQNNTQNGGSYFCKDITCMTSKNNRVGRARVILIMSQRSRASKRGGFKRGGSRFPFSSFSVLFGGFPDFFRDVFSILSRDFPDLSFFSFSAYYNTYKEHSLKGSATESGPFPKKWGTPRFGNLPG